VTVPDTCTFYHVKQQAADLFRVDPSQLSLFHYSTPPTKAIPSLKEVAAKCLLVNEMLSEKSDLFERLPHELKQYLVHVCSPFSFSFSYPF